MARRYLVDENITPPALADQLRRRQPELEVANVGDDVAPPKGTLDSDILLWIETYGFTLITRNRKSMPEYLFQHLEAGRHIPGILTLRPKALLGEIIEDLILISKLLEEDEYLDQIIHIPL